MRVHEMSSERQRIEDTSVHVAQLNGDLLCLCNRRSTDTRARQPTEPTDRVDRRRADCRVKACYLV